MRNQAPWSLLLPFILATNLDTSATEQMAATRSEPQVIVRGPHEQRIEFTTSVVAADGARTLVTNSLVQIETGLNRWDENLGTFVPASAAIEIVDGHGVIRNAQYQAVFARNANDPGGLIDLFMPGGERLGTQPIGLALTEPETGASIFLAELQDSEGVLLDEHTMVYPNAFDLVEASIVIRSSLRGIESDVLIQENISDDLVAALGIDPKTARLEVWHQVLSKPNADLKENPIQRHDGRRELDRTIHFSQMAIDSGTAFLLDDDSPASEQLQVAKEWVTLEGIDFLIESVPLSEAKPFLENLPVRQEARNIDRRRIELALSRARTESGDVAMIPKMAAPLPLEQQKQRKRKPLSIASDVKRTNPAPQRADESSDLLALGSHKKGFLIDFPVNLTTQTNFTFKGDTTYWVTGAVDLFGTTTLEGGAVIKSTNYTSLSPVITIRGPFKCETSPYNPAIFTAEDDDTVGERISSSTGTPLTGTFYSWYNLRFFNSDTNAIYVHDIQSRYSHVGVGFQTPATSYVWNIIVYNCDRGIETHQAEVIVRNALINRTRYSFNIGNGSTQIIRAENATVNSARKLFNYSSGTPQLYLTNTLLCTSTEMRAILRQTTTYAPSLLTNSISTATTLSPTVQRDSDTPDLGYHYHPIDYFASGVPVSSTLTLTNAVSIGVYGIHGFSLNSGSSFLSGGSPTRMNHLTRYEAVQEDPTTRWGSTPVSILNMGFSGRGVRLRFTRVNHLARSPGERMLLAGFGQAYNAVTPLAISDSELRGVSQSLNTFQSGSTVSLTNNVIQNCSLAISQGPTGYYTYSRFTLNVFNNIFKNGSAAFTYSTNTTTWTVRDNLFDSDSLSGGTLAFSASYNAYRSGLVSLGGSANVTGLAPDYVAGPLGSYYYPASGGNLFQLINNGSRNATNAGLYHFTTSAAAGSKEMNSTVDIGFHYVGVDANGVPFDADEDTIPDYLEDRKKRCCECRRD